eukprot:224184-Amphidinium_carterae.1
MEDVFCSPKVEELMRTTLQRLVVLQEFDRLMMLNKCEMHPMSCMYMYFPQSSVLQEFESLTIDATFRMLYSLHGQVIPTLARSHV